MSLKWLLDVYYMALFTQAKHFCSTSKKKKSFVSLFNPFNNLAFQYYRLTSLLWLFSFKSLPSG